MTFIEWLTAWAKSRNITSHSVAVAAIIVATIVSKDQQARDFVLGLFQAHPKIGTYLVALAMLIAKYAPATSAAGSVVRAQAVMASPQAPTTKEIADAKTTK